MSETTVDRVSIAGLPISVDGSLQNPNLSSTSKTKCRYIVYM